MQTNDQLFLGRQPILDRAQALHAFELLFRSSEANRATILDNTVASATVIVRTFAELGVEAALGQYKGFINVGSALLMSDAIEMLPREKVVLEILETVAITPEVVERCRDLKGMGFTLALDDFSSLDELSPELMPLVDVVKVDLKAVAAHRLEALTIGLRRWPVRLLAEKVDVPEEVERCMRLGYDLFQGYHFARPKIITGRRLSTPEVGLMRLLGLVMADAENTEIEAALKQHPGLTIKLMRLTNSAATGTRHTISSVRQAITIMGRRQLQRWLQLLVYAASSDDAHLPGPLLQMAATRGKLLELLARDRDDGGDFEDRAFMTGILSLMDVVFNMPIGAIIGPLGLSEDVRDALLDRTGDLGRLLLLAEALEADDRERTLLLIRQFRGLDLEEVNAAQTAAMGWANSIGITQTG